MEDSHFSSLSGVGRQPDCLAHVVEATEISDPSASEADVAERARRSVQPELVGERDRSLGRGQCGSPLPWRKSARATSVSASTWAGPLGNGSSSAKASPGSSTQRGSARRERRLASTCIACAIAGEIATLLKQWGCLLQCLFRLDGAASVERGLGEAHKRVRPVGVRGRGEHQRSLEIGERRISVEAKGAFSRPFRNGGPAL